MTAPRNVVITGASSGLGRALARWFAARGDRVWAAARRADRLRALAGEPRPGAGQITPLALDVADVPALRRALLALDADVPGGIDLAIANAGVGEGDDPREDRWDVTERMIQVNVTGLAATLSTLAPRMVQRRRGQLVGISSLAAWLPSPGTATYAATKAFVEMYCAGLRLSLAPSGVHVTCVHAGFVRTEMTAGNRFRMPFLLEVDDAADRAGRAIVRRAGRVAFPWQMALLTRALAALPERLLVRLLPPP